MDLTKHLKQAIEQAPHNPWIKDVQLEGMTSDLVRGLLNNLVDAPRASYLEIGVWKGATFVSALYKNKPALAVGIDDFSLFDGPKEEFRRNLERYQDDLPPYTFIDGDCWKINKAEITQPINIYFYDGDHSQESQRKALTDFYNVLDHSFIYICDDWNWQQVQNGTSIALSRLRLRTEFATVLHGNHTKLHWWNGVFAAVLSKMQTPEQLAPLQQPNPSSR